MLEFRWNDWNYDHVGKHQVDPAEVEYVVRRARSPYPERREEEKWLVIGQTEIGRYLQVVYILDPDDTIYVIHAREINDREKRRYRRRIR